MCLAGSTTEETRLLTLRLTAGEGILPARQRLSGHGHLFELLRVGLRRQRTPVSDLTDFCKATMGPGGTQFGHITGLFDVRWSVRDMDQDAHAVHRPTLAGMPQSHLGAR